MYKQGKQLHKNKQNKRRCWNWFRVVHGDTHPLAVECMNTGDEPVNYMVDKDFIVMELFCNGI